MFVITKIKKSKKAVFIKKLLYLHLKHTAFVLTKYV